MRPPSVTITDDGGILLSHLAPWFMSVLLQVPDLLDADERVFLLGEDIGNIEVCVRHA